MEVTGHLFKIDILCSVEPYMVRGCSSDRANPELHRYFLCVLYEEFMEDLCVMALQKHRGRPDSSIWVGRRSAHTSGCGLFMYVASGLLLQAKSQTQHVHINVSVWYTVMCVYMYMPLCVCLCA